MSKPGDILKATATSYVLRGLTLVATYLAQKGLRADDVLTPENLAILAGAAVVYGVDLVTTIYRKRATHNLIEAARNAEPGTPMSIIKSDAKAL